MGFFGLDFKYIALNPKNILEGKYIWTLLTSMFMHSPSSIFHLFVNMLSLFFIGSFVERIIGSKRYLKFYLASGIFSGIFFVLWSFLFNTDLNVYAVGASGAIFSLVGLLVILTPNIPVYIMFIPYPIKIKYAAPGLLLLLWIISIAGNIPIGNSAHLGGLLFGLGYGLFLKTKFKRKTRILNEYFR